MNDCSLLSPSQGRYQYDVCGLCVESDIPFSLPQLAQRAIPDIRFSLKALGHSTDTIFFCKVGEFLAYMPLRLSIGTDKDQP